MDSRKRKNKEIQSADVFNLPNEALLHIFSFLNHRELALASKVCKHFNEIATDDYAVKNSLPISFDYSKPTGKIGSIKMDGFSIGAICRANNFIAVSYYPRTFLMQNDSNPHKIKTYKTQTTSFLRIYNYDGKKNEVNLNASFSLNIACMTSIPNCSNTIIAVTANNEFVTLKLNEEKNIFEEVDFYPVKFSNNEEQENIEENVSDYETNAIAIESDSDTSSEEDETDEEDMEIFNHIVALPNGDLVGYYKRQLHTWRYDFDKNRYNYFQKLLNANNKMFIGISVLPDGRFITQSASFTKLVVWEFNEKMQHYKCCQILFSPNVNEPLTCSDVFPDGRILVGTFHGNIYIYKFDPENSCFTIDEKNISSNKSSILSIASLKAIDNENFISSSGDGIFLWNKRDNTYDSIQLKDKNFAQKMKFDYVITPIISAEWGRIIYPVCSNSWEVAELHIHSFRFLREENIQVNNNNKFRRIF